MPAACAAGVAFESGAAALGVAQRVGAQQPATRIPFAAPISS